MSNNFEISYALNNQCIPCNLIGKKNEKQYINLLTPQNVGNNNYYGNNFLCPGGMGTGAGLRGTIPFQQTASEPFSDNYIKKEEEQPVAERRSRLVRAMARSNQTDKPISTAAYHALSGYTAAQRIAYTGGGI